MQPHVIRKEHLRPCPLSDLLQGNRIHLWKQSGNKKSQKGCGKTVVAPRSSPLCVQALPFCARLANIIFGKYLYFPRSHKGIGEKQESPTIRLLFLNTQITEAIVQTRCDTVPSGMGRKTQIGTQILILVESALNSNWNLISSLQLATNPISF